MYRKLCGSTLVILIGTVSLWGCSPRINEAVEITEMPLESPSLTLEIGEDAEISPMNSQGVISTSPVEEGGSMSTPSETLFADVISVETTGSPGSYRFSVGVRSPDTGCEQYADWWEVVSQEGELHYRRILLHSHVGEQPFVRSGGPVSISPDTVVWVRAHMNTAGYGGVSYKGSVQDGFSPTDIDPDFAIDLETVPPFPEDCNF